MNGFPILFLKLTFKAFLESFQKHMLNFRETHFGSRWATKSLTKNEIFFNKKNILWSKSLKMTYDIFKELLFILFNQILRYNIFLNSFYLIDLKFLLLSTMRRFVFDCISWSVRFGITLIFRAIYSEARSLHKVVFPKSALLRYLKVPFL